MDTFFEQIVKIKLSVKVKTLIALIFVADCIIVSLVLLFAPANMVPFVFLIIVGVVYGSYKLISQASIEYEYIFINGDLDIDKIIAKSSRKRIVSIKCSEVERFGVYTGQQASSSIKKTHFLCDSDSENMMYMIVPNRAEGMVMIVFAPDDRIREAISKAVPRIAQ
ncbi:MAG: hypothetical protein J6Q56_00330 [Clostridia bacterium]|nr:hypothetical protein [Clostridia bacterium]